MRQLIGVGTPRGLQGRLVAHPWTHAIGCFGQAAVVASLFVLIRSLWKPTRRSERLARPASPRECRSTTVNVIVLGGVSEMAFTTGSQSALDALALSNHM